MLFRSDVSDTYQKSPSPVWNAAFTKACGARATIPNILKPAATRTLQCANPTKKGTRVILGALSVDRARIELATHGFSGRCSTD